MKVIVTVSLAVWSLLGPTACSDDRGLPGGEEKAGRICDDLIETMRMEGIERDACIKALQAADRAKAQLIAHSVEEYVSQGGMVDEGFFEALEAVFPGVADAYRRSVLTSEAVDMLDRIYKGASDYFATPIVAKGASERLACRYPADQALTPSVTCRDSSVDKDGDGRCDADSDAWLEPTWAAMEFQIAEQHHFVYSFDSEGIGADAKFTATAHADLDGDGLMSTFQRHGRGEVDTSLHECWTAATGPLFRSNPTE